LISEVVGLTHQMFGGTIGLHQRHEAEQSGLPYLIRDAKTMRITETFCCTLIN